MTVNGAALAGAETMDVINPATGEVCTNAPQASKTQVDEAIACARSAFSQWKTTTIEERQSLVKQAARILEANIEELAQILLLEHGRPLQGCMMELQAAIQYFDDFAAMTPEVLVTEDSDVRRVEVHYEPLGVVCAIPAWNFPITLSAMKICPALVAGNTLVLRPSPTTSLTLLRIGELLRDVFPAGVFNVISGNGLGSFLTSHSGFDKISYTGSTETGKQVMAAGADSLRRMTLELGGNDAAIVLPDVDIEKVAPQIFFGAFFNSAQICVATKRLYIHADIYEPLRDALHQIAKASKMGDGSEPDTVLGPIQNQRQYRSVSALLEHAQKEGLTLLTGYQPENQEGYFIPATLVDNPPHDSRVVTEEAFGPILPLIKFDNEDDLIQQVNSSKYGLAGAIWAQDTQKAVTLAKRMDTGTVWINENLYLPASTPFGGHKQSGIGVENGMAGLLGFMQQKAIYIPK
ncbi:aldehyde dehydrogenase family protein [Pseudomaricurvus alkylphenolicus]|nr:aldehyde dehydrogenase family protein [Pseudomaricurvus alkylphenolicus]